ncbi:phosphatidylinositol-3,5-bisphosphate 5-phosphatase [Dimargaris verticillata]|uniref:Phosphatidylinositol-3,5-bisphosphate 5-phosphatase n=1 Tax=Dimargaris verticillata TaxID=2761393 RepID=A0A9W8E8E7_9FUNG|nr:phosphatidylinositol-3,5-bisphosphate 5-phosphatase [Dimargaris verticillata]
MATSSHVVVDATRPCRLVLNKITLYETKTRYYIVGSNPSDTRFRVLKIDRTTTSALHLVEDDVVYDKEQIRDLLSMIELGNKTTGGLHKVVTAYGIVGFIRFTGSYYICLITQRSAVAVLGGHYIYHIDGTMLLNIATDDRSVRTPQENRYLSLFHSVDMTKNFYFSYTYDLTHTLQYNMTQTKDEDQLVYNDMFVWNHYLLNTGFESLRSNSDWILPVIYGFVNQSSLNVFGRNLYITLIARRSRFFAGARFLKRGVNNQGYVANEVETEQIVHEQITTSFHRPGQLFGNPVYTAYVQHRGSIPLYWSQDTSNMTPKPPIEINTVDPYFSAAALHLDHLFKRYGSPVILLNLIKRKERVKRESKLGSEFEQAISYLNQFLPERNRLLYIAWDMSRADKNPKEDVFEVLEEISEQAIQRTDFFHSGPEPLANMLRSTRYTSVDASGARKPFRLQNGVLRSNCIDCLDRTNTAQNMTGRCALGYQLYALGVIPKPFVAFDSEAVNLLNDMYRRMGNTIALQYGGSQLVNTIESYQKINPWSNQSRDMIETFRRYYSNSFIDSDKQDAINLFLGNFVSRMGEPSLWELGTDYHLHNKDLTNRRLDRSYVHWWSDDALRSKYETAKHIPRAMVIHPIGPRHHLDEENEHPLMSYWIEYYRPRLYTSFSRLFAFNMNSTLKKTHGLNGTDVSPLASIDAQWHSGTIVDPTEAQEYQRYVNQFKGQVHFQAHWEDTLGLTSGAQHLTSASKQADAVDDTKVSYLTNHPDYATYFDYVKSANTAMVTGFATAVPHASDATDVYHQYMQSTEAFLAQPAGQPRQLASHPQYEAYRHWLKTGKFRFPKKK